MPVLGAMPTLGAKARQSYFVATARLASVEPSAVPSELS
jgi:hypothetical protein